ncbi:hypothetical protein C8Q74DRAFT_1259848 [Fomes fomentarius]|nr:hypothetical protein C8Q74DRAFT_1259848 [Fomes fomentarius]
MKPWPGTEMSVSLMTLRGVAEEQFNSTGSGNPRNGPGCMISSLCERALARRSSPSRISIVSASRTTTTIQDITTGIYSSFCSALATFSIAGSLGELFEHIHAMQNMLRENMPCALSSWSYTNLRSLRLHPHPRCIGRRQRHVQIRHRSLMSTMSTVCMICQCDQSLGPTSERCSASCLRDQIYIVGLNPRIGRLLLIIRMH